MKAALAAAREAQQKWEATAPRRRLAVVRQLRFLIAAEATALAQLAAAPNDRPVAEKLVSEVVPLLDACRFLERQARWVLREKRQGAHGRPLWLRGSFFVIERKPFGVVLIVGPGNYPLFLPGVQLLQALVAGNAVLLKSAENCSAPLRWLVERMRLAPDLVQMLPEPPESARAAVRAGVDKVIFTGATENGRSLLGLMAERNTPGVFELTGADSVFVRHDADLERAAQAIEFGQRFNAGETCMAPQVIFAHESIAQCLRGLLAPGGASPGARRSVVASLPEERRGPPTLARTEPSAPGELEVRAFTSDAEALEIARCAECGLGASIFSSDEKAARAFADQLPTGFVTINDLIVPTADPRFPFGGVRASGFGSTRGAEGLLEMTYPHVVAVRRGRALPHLAPPQPNEEKIFATYIKTAYGSGLGRRARALRELFRAAK